MLRLTTVDAPISDSKPREKFAVRLLRVLRAADSDPEQVPTLGITWCRDGRSFISHPRLISVTLGLKQNSINTNFRDHGFEISDCTPASIVEEFGNLPEPHLWKKRSHISGQFTRNTSPEAAERIQIRKSPKLDVVTCASSVAFVQKHDPWKLLPHGSLAESQARSVMKMAEGDQEWKDRMLNQVVSDWVTDFGMDLEVDRDAFVEVVLTGVSDEIFRQLRAIILDIMFFCGEQLTEDQRRVAFPDYLTLMFRFGPNSRFRSSLQQLSKSFSRHYTPNFLFPSPGHSQSPEFQVWFHPELTDKTAYQLLEQERVYAWLVRTSSSKVNFFTLQVKKQTGIVSTYIRYDGLASDDMLYAVDWDTGGVRYAESWNRLLFDVLCLNRHDAVRSETGRNRKGTRFVNASELISIKPPVLQLSQGASGFPASLDTNAYQDCPDDETDLPFEI
jgi:hypothetical protein